MADIRRALLMTSALVVGVGLVPFAANAKAPPDQGVGLATTGIGHTEETIVEVHLRRQEKLSGGMIAHLAGDDMLVPLQEVALLLEFAIEETPDGARGWFIAENRTFALDMKSGEVRSDGQAFKIKPGDVRRFDKQLFVSTRALSQWLPLNFQADNRALVLQISPREVTPRELRAARNSGKQYGSIHQFLSSNPKIEVPYALAQVPGVEVDLGVGYTSQTFGSRDSRFFPAGTARLFGDFLYMNGDVFVTGTDRGVVDARARFGRVDPDGGLLGVLNATAWQVGDVSSTSIPLVSHGIAGRGFHLSSRPLSYVAEFDRVTIEDSVAVGHEVELYRNGVLMASQPPSTTGRYKFENVPLLRGTNELRIEHYGPQGQRRTETRQYIVGDQQMPVGKLDYEFTFNEVGRSVFGFNNWSRDHQMFYEDTSIGGAARFGYGLSRWMSLTGGLAAAPLPARVRKADGDDYRFYGSLGSRMIIGNFAVNLDTAFDDRGGVAAGVGFSTAVSGWNLSVRHEQFMNDYASDIGYSPFLNIGSYAYRTSNSTARADTNIGQLWPGVFLSVGVAGNYITYDSIDPSWRIGFTSGVSAGRFSFGNDLYYGGAITRGNEGFLGSSRANLRLFDNVNLRAGIDYDMRGQAELEGLSVGLTAPVGYDVLLGLNYARRFDYLRSKDLDESYSASLRRKFGFAELGVIGSYSRYDPTDVKQTTRVDDYRVGLTASFSTLTDPRTFKTLMSSDRIARQGFIRPEVFHDTNQNAVLDPNEDRLADARVGFMGQRDPFVTGGPNPLMGPVNPGSWTDVAVDRGGLDPTLKPSGGYAILPRPGVVADVQLPVVATAGIEGRASVLLGRERRALPNVKVQVVRKDEAAELVVAEVHTEFDGSFSFGSVPVGQYTLRLEPDQAKQIGARRPVEMNIDLTPDTKILDGIALNLTRS